MTDLSIVLPNFPTHEYTRILQVLEKNKVTTADLLTFGHEDLVKFAEKYRDIPAIRGLSNAVQQALQRDLGLDGKNSKPVLKKTGSQLVESWSTISTLDEDLDAALGGGIPAGYMTEVTGESGAGKTQFLLMLLLSVQLPAPYGLGASAIYISTESPLPTTRLTSMIKSHPFLSRLAAADRPTLDRVINVSTPDLESQDHILRYQLPVAVERHGVKLIILDSVAANYRAEFERGLGGMNGGGKNMAQRSGELVKLGELLRNLSRDHGVAIVVANQVADRFSADNRGSSPIKRSTQSSPLATRNIPASSMGRPESSAAEIPDVVVPFRGTSDPMSLDHQQRWFTGWGDDPNPSRLASMRLKTPSLGLIWTTQIACRIALIKRPVYGPGLIADEETERGEPVLRKWRRWMKVVFTPHAKASGPGLEDAVEVEIRADGLASVKKKITEIDDEREQDTPA